MMGYMYVVWIAVIVAAVIIEAMTEQLISIWFVACGIVGILLNAFRINEGLQVLIAAAVTLGLLVLTRPFVKSKLNFEKTRTNADRYVGQQGIVVESIDNTLSKGQIKIGGSIWTARSMDDCQIDASQRVTVVRIEGVKAIVQAVEKPVGG